MNKGSNQSRFSGKGLERRIQKLLSGKIHPVSLYGWVREGRITAQDFNDILIRMGLASNQ